MFKLLAKDVNFSWNTHCQTAFQVLKERLSTALVLRGPNWSLPFHICTDALNTTLGVVLGQRENQIPYVIYFVSKNLLPTKLNYIVNENKLLVVVHAISKFNIVTNQTRKLPITHFFEVAKNHPILKIGDS